MSVVRYILARLFYGALLILGVTLISFLLMVYWGPDQTYQLLGKNPNPAQIDELRKELGYDAPFFSRYGSYLRETLTLDLGLSNSSGEPVLSIISRTLPITLALTLPGFLLGNLLGLLLGMVSAWNRGKWLDRLIMGTSVAGMSISFLVFIILLQVLLCTPYGLNLFPSRGWDVHDAGSYFYYVAVPTLALILVTLGYNTQFYRTVIAEELARDHIRTVRAFGGSANEILFRHVLKNSLSPIMTRLVFSIPLVVVSGSLLLETYFGIPGVGRATFDAISSGDQPVLKAIVTLTAITFVIAQIFIDLVYRVADPRIATR